MTDAHETLLRPATPDDAPALGALWADAFPGERTAEERTRALLDDTDPYGGLDDAYVAVVDGEPVGAVRTYRLRLHLRGREHPTLGVGAVAVTPGSRRRGLGRRICVEAMRIGRERGDALSLLFPFRADFYARLGYALVGERHRYRFGPEDLVDVADPGVVEALPGDGWDAAREVYASVCRRSDGSVVREERHWRRLERPEAHALLHRDAEGTPDGYAVVAPLASAGEDAVRVLELVSVDGSASRALLSHLVRDEGREWAEHDAFPSERLDRLLRHPERPEGGGPGLWFESAILLRGPMLRILHPGRIATGPGELRVDDAELPENRGRWSDGARTSGDPGRDAPDASGAARLLGSGALPGLPPPPPGWEPLPGGGGFHLREEF